MIFTRGEALSLFRLRERPYHLWQFLKASHSKMNPHRAVAGGDIVVKAESANAPAS